MAVSVLLQGGPLGSDQVLDLPYDSAPESIPVQVASGEVVYQRTGSRDSTGRRIYRPAELLDRLGVRRPRARPEPAAAPAKRAAAKTAAPAPVPVAAAPPAEDPAEPEPAAAREPVAREPAAAREPVAREPAARPAQPAQRRGPAPHGPTFRAPGEP